MTENGPLAGLRIIDLTAMVLGPYATQILADYGADVVKVEPPRGDLMRTGGAQKSRGMGALFLHLNRNKRSVVLDLKKPAARAALLRLCANADVLVHNNRPAAMRRLNLGDAEIRKANPRLIYVESLRLWRNRPLCRQAGLRRSDPGRRRAAVARRSSRWRGAALRAADNCQTASSAFTPYMRSSPRSFNAIAPATAAPSSCRCSKPWRNWCSAITSADVRSIRRSATAAMRGC